MARPKLKGYTTRERKDCNRWELLMHPDRRLGLPQAYCGLFKTKVEAEAEGKRLMGIGRKMREGGVPW